MAILLSRAPALRHDQQRRRAHRPTARRARAGIWREIAELFGLAGDLPPWQIVKEKRATFAATPEQDAKRPPARTAGQMSSLAGDWTQTGLPATIEGAVRSGYKAADHPRTGRVAPKSAPECFAMNVALDHGSFASTEVARRPYFPRVEGAARQPAPGWPLVLRTRGGRDDPCRIRAAPAFSRRKARISSSNTRSASIFGAFRATHGGWPLVHAGAFDMSASVKAYFALKMIGDDPDAPHMRRAREAVLAHGGAASEQRLHPLPARAVRRNSLARRSDHAGRDHAAAALVSVSPDKISYWARTVLVPFARAAGLKPQAENPRGVTIKELFVAPPETVRKWPTGAHQTGGGEVLRRGRLAAQARGARFSRSRCAAAPSSRGGFRDRASQWRQRPRRDLSRHGERGADVRCDRLFARSSAISSRRAQSIERLLVVQATRPIASLACRRSGTPRSPPTPCSKPAAKRRGASEGWPRVAQAVAGSGRQRRLGRPAPRRSPGRVGVSVRQPPLSRPGRHRRRRDGDGSRDRGGVTATRERRARRDRRARGNGSRDCKAGTARWGAFDADNFYHYLNNIPFADHGALLDPPTADVTARCLSMLAQLGETRRRAPPWRAASTR